MIPSKEFPCRCRFSKFKQFSFVAGISQDKLFLETSKELIFFKLPSSTGNFPLNELYNKLSDSDKERKKKKKFASIKLSVDKLPIELGKTPFNWFASIPSSSIFVQFLKVIKKSKSLPKLLLVRRRSLRSSRYPKLVGTDPTKLLLPRSSF